MATAAELKARLAKYAVKKEEANVISEQTSSPVAATAPQESVRTEGIPPVLGSNEASNSVIHHVVTDVQSTDVVIVERPASDVSDRGESGTSSTGGKTDELDPANPIHQSFLQRLADLEAALLDRDPLMKTHLGAIHKAMIEHEEIANLLKVEEIAKIMSAQQQHTGMVLRAEVVGKSKAAAGKKAAGLGLNDV